MAKLFDIHKSHVSYVKRQYWNAIDAGEIYPNLQPHKKGRVGTKSALTEKSKKNIAKLNRKTNGRVDIRELAHANATEYHASCMFSYMYVQCTSFDYATNGISCQVCSGSI